MNKINKYIFLEISKGALLIFFIFLSISWLLQFTRLISLTNLLQVDMLTILYLSLFLIPNLITIIMPFVIMFGLIITFIKLDKDRELISIFSLGLSIKSITKPIFYFSMIILLILIIFNFYFAPKIYQEYKIKEFEIRNNINFEKIKISNFIEINKNTFLDFKKNNQKFEEVFIKFSEDKDNIIYSKNADISQSNNKFIFKLIDGFKITILEDNKIEKLEFENYTLELENNSYNEFNNFDNNTLDIFDDIKNKNYTNIFNKILDSLLVILIIFVFYYNNIKEYKFNVKSIFYYLCFSTLLLLINQIIKNSEFNLVIYFSFSIITIFLLIIYISYKKNYV